MRLLHRFRRQADLDSKSEVKTRQCWQPWESLNIAADGTVYPCCVVNKALVVGSLKDQSLEEIVAGAAMIDLKRRLLTGDIADLPCAECTNAPIGLTGDYFSQLKELLAR